MTVIRITDPSVTSWTVPVGVTEVDVEVWGGGGSGGDDNGTTSCSGGGGGGYSRKNGIATTPGASIAIKVGSGGIIAAGSGEGVPGEDSWFDDETTVLAKGGQGGQDLGQALGGQADDGVGDVKYSGGASGRTSATREGTGGGSAATPTADGAEAADVSGGSGASAPGGGFGGAAGGTSAAGGDGQDSENGGGGGGGSRTRAGGNGGFPGGGGGGTDSFSTYKAGNGGHGEVRITIVTAGGGGAGDSDHTAAIF